MRELLKPRFREYAELVLEKNKLLNLTAAKTLDELYDRHIEDGLAALPWLQQRFGDATYTVADIGAGAGFIGIAMKLAVPSIRLTLVESRERRCEFLEWVSIKLKLEDVEVLKSRAEVLVGETGRDFDVVVERALAPLKESLALCLPLVGPRGVFLAYQGEASSGFEVPGGKHVDTIRYRLPGETRERAILCFEKDASA